MGYAIRIGKEWVKRTAQSRDFLYRKLPMTLNPREARIWSRKRDAVRREEEIAARLSGVRGAYFHKTIGQLEGIPEIISEEEIWHEQKTAPKRQG